MIPLMFLAQFCGVLQVFLLASFTRTLKWHAILVAFFAGIALCTPGALLLQLGWTHFYAVVTHQPYANVAGTAAYTLDPLIEELVKVLPLLLACLVRKVRLQLGVVDIVIISLALGSGFGLAEDLLRFSYLAGKPVVETGAGNWLFPFGLNIILVPGLVSILTSWIPQGATAITPGLPFQAATNIHLALSALVGLAVGLLVRRDALFQRRSSEKNVLLILAAVFCFALSVLVHMANNTPPLVAQQNPQFGIIALVFGQGIEQHLLFLFPLIALGVALFLDYRTVQRVLGSDPAVRLRAEGQGFTGLLNFALAYPGKPWSTDRLWNFVLKRRAYAFQQACAPGNPAFAQERSLLSMERSFLEQQPPIAPPALFARLLARGKLSAARAIVPDQGDISTAITAPLSHATGTATSSATRARRFLKLLLAGSLLFALPPLLYFLAGSLPPFAGVQTWLANPTIFALLRIWLFAGLAWQGTTLILHLRVLPQVLKQASGSIILVDLFGVMTTLGSLGSGIGGGVVSLLPGQEPLQPAIAGGHILDAFLSSPVLTLLLLALLLLLIAFLPEILTALAALVAGLGEGGGFALAGGGALNSGSIAAAAAATEGVAGIAAQGSAVAIVAAIILMMAGSNQNQNRQFKDAIRQYEHDTGTKLNKDQSRQVHEDISKEGLDFQGIIDAIYALFGG